MASKLVASAPTLLSKFIRHPAHRSYEVTPLSIVMRSFSSRSAPQKPSVSFDNGSNPFLRAGEIGHCRVDKTRKNCCIMRVDVPGIPDDKMVLWAESGYIYFNAIDSPIARYNYHSRVFGGSISCDPKKFDLENMKSEVRDGVLWIVVPKLKK